MATSRLAWQTLKARPATVSTLLVVGAAGAYFGTQHLIPTAHAESKEPPKVFGGFGFRSLRLRSSEAVNHNTKRLVFEFPDENAQSGLPLTCEYMKSDLYEAILNKALAALLTFSRPEGRLFPVLRPYTPISSLGMPPSINNLECAVNESDEYG